MLSLDAQRLHSAGRLAKRAFSIEAAPTRDKYSTSDIDADNKFIMCWLRHPSSQQRWKILLIVLVLSPVSSMRFKIVWIMAVYVMLSGRNPADGIESKADNAICRAFLPLSSFPVAEEQDLILNQGYQCRKQDMWAQFVSAISCSCTCNITHRILKDTKLGLHPISSICSNIARTRVSLSGSSLLEIHSATVLKVTSDILHLTSPLLYRWIDSSSKAVTRDTRSRLVLFPHCYERTASKWKMM